MSWDSNAVENHRNDTFVTRVLMLLAFVLCAIVTTSIVANPGISPLEDYMLRGVASDETLKPFIFPEDGRFYPLAGVEFRPAELFSPSISAFYWTVFVQIILTCSLFFLFLRSHFSYAQASLGLILLIMTPGFMTAAYRLIIPERGALLLLVIFLFAENRYVIRSSLVSALSAISAASLAMYYKEPIALALAAYVISRTAFTKSKVFRKLTLIDVGTLISVAIFFVLYYLLIYSQQTGQGFGTTEHNGILVRLRVIVGFATSDPILMILSPAILVQRIFSIRFGTEQFDEIFDPLLIAGLVYVAAFLTLNIYQPYYLLPAYAFTIPALLRFSIAVWTSKFIRGLTLLLFAVSSLPLAIHLATYYNNLQVNYEGVLASLPKALSESKSRRPAVFIDGVRPLYNEDLHFVLGSTMIYRGLSQEDFDVKSELSARSYSDAPRFSFNIDSNSPFSVYHSIGPSKPVLGDLLIVGPDTPLTVTSDYLNLTRCEFTVINSFSSKYFFPNISLNNLLLTVGASMALSIIGYTRYTPTSNWQQAPDYYILRKTSDFCLAD